jgi:hypothetical protein
MALSYYGDPISENCADTDEGYRICRNAVLARTGYQTYYVHELSESIREKLREFGYDLQDDDEIEFYRSEEEVFSPIFIASLEGKPLTDEHPDELVSAETHADHHVGHVQNVRRRAEPLKSGELGLAGDVFITDSGAVDKHRAGRRQLSCGYTYDIRQDGKRILMVNMLGNHVALVPKGRAGKEVGINDAAPEQLQREPFDMSKFLEMIRGKGTLAARVADFKAWAADAKPEEVADALGKIEAKDAEEHPEKCKCSDCAPQGKDAMALKAANDAAAAAGKAGDKGKGKDDESGELTPEEVAEAIAALKLLEEATAEDADGDEDEDGEADDADEDEDDEDEDDKDGKKGKKKGEADDADIVTPVDPLDPADRPKGLIGDSGIAFLKALRPMAARSKDAKFRAAFDAAAKAVNTRTPVKGKGYDKFTKAAQRSKATGLDTGSAQPSEAKQAADLEALYAKHRGKPTTTEVK